MVTILTTGAIFVMWLGEQITERGIGNGMSILIFFSIIEGLWPSTLQLIGFVGDRVVSVLGVIIFIGILVAMVAAVVAMTLAARRIPIQIPQRTSWGAGGCARGRRPSSRSG